ncbi:hypothetical protein CI109_106644 [Kwoniella shandongensis]|uniref:Uncharacterized protein n=1 Tax=Kwoniella shandongensis TaxID=1734106 RepID=A0A5M6BNL5_9TREE|nr:uncharacterized protein CI109_007208 [Kwoniella shandongensis]KAA5524458.1 hypothetical protein CI109_007208 [Kwoniella shandongensis]
MGSDNEKQPEGGYDSTRLPPSSSPTYTVRITFHSASNLPVADLSDGLSDPFILAQLTTSHKTRHDKDPYLRYRSKTVQRSLEPRWDSSWVVGGVPSDGFKLEARIYDEDPQDHDDRLGKIEYTSGPLDSGFKGIREESFKVKRSGVDLKAYAIRWLCVGLHKSQKLHAELVMSVEVLGKTEKDKDNDQKGDEPGKAYTLNGFWFKHYSPMIGRLTGTKGKDSKGAEKYDFEANEIQLRGPVPDELYHRYVDFKPFVSGMFTGTGLRGRILHKALHHQHERIYNFDKKTEYGEFSSNGSEEEQGKERALKFLEMVHYDQGGRIFTYVITLDGMFRFTETGKEFGIDLLSKHTMHSDVNIYIAWSGEFLIRRLSRPDKSPSDPEQHTHPAEPVSGGPPKTAPPKDPAAYELIIDNDSGTYRPDAKLIPVLKKFLEKQFPEMKITVMNCTDDKLEKIKEDQKKTKGKEGQGMVIGQGSTSSLGSDDADGDGGSISSSDEEDLEERARMVDDDNANAGNGGTGMMGKLDQGVNAVEKPKETIKGALGLGKGKEEREKAEAKEDQL